MTVKVAIRHQLGSFTLDAAFESAGKLTALFGPSGCGKTSIINVIAGLIQPQEAHISVNEEMLADTARGSFLPAHRRRIGYVFQDARLLPHLSVAQNLAYGRWFTPKEERYADEKAIIAMLGLGELLARRPRQLSGGEKQRVALGRALLQSPRLLLMDEPLASLDEARKQEVLPYIERLRDEVNIPIIYVSHAPTEVARLASNIVLLKDGRVVKAGSAAEILPSLGLLGDEFAHETGSLLEMTVVSFDPQFGLTTLGKRHGEVTLWQGNHRSLGYEAIHQQIAITEGPTRLCHRQINVDAASFARDLKASYFFVFVFALVSVSSAVRCLRAAIFAARSMARNLEINVIPRDVSAAPPPFCPPILDVTTG